MSKSNELGVDGALAITDPMKMFTALLEVHRVNWRSTLGGRPDLVEMVRILRAFDLDVSTSGIAKFLTDGDCGEHVEDTKRWCRLIGATRAAEYLIAVEKEFPASVIPQDDFERADVVEELNNQSAQGAFHELDIAYKGATEEMIYKLQSYLLAHKRAATEAFSMRTSAAPGDPLE